MQISKNNKQRNTYIVIQIYKNKNREYINISNLRYLCINMRYFRIISIYFYDIYFIEISLNKNNTITIALTIMVS